MNARVVSLSRSESHVFSKQPFAAAQLLAGLGMEGDVHAGRAIRHRSRVAVDPDQPNLRQVHLLSLEPTGLRNPCAQLDQIGPGLMQRLARRGADGRLIRRAGVMAIVRVSGLVRRGDPIDFTLPAEPHVAMDKV